MRGNLVDTFDVPGENDSWEILSEYDLCAKIKYMLTFPLLYV